MRVNWFPARPYPQLLAKPTPGTVIGPKREFTLTFSSPVAEVLGSRRPRLSPALPGDWRLVDAHTLAFRPRGLGFGLGTEVHVVLPQPVHLAGQKGAVLTSTLRWQVPEGSTLRLQQLLAQLGYLPLDWHPSANAVLELGRRRARGRARTAARALLLALPQDAQGAAEALAPRPAPT